MFELIVMIACTVLMAKVADLENRSGIIWGALTLGLCILSFAIPLPFVRLLIALAVSFGTMWVLNARQED